MVSPAFPGMFFAFAAMVLLIFASVSPPTWDKVNFLDASAGGQRTVFGVFGECVVGGSCTKGLGYSLTLMGASMPDLNEAVLRRLTNALILHPIAAGLGFISFAMGAFGVLCASRFATIMASIFAMLGGLVALAAFVLDMVLWNLIKNKITAMGYSASLGNANWFTVGAVVAFFLATCTSLCGACGRFATGRAAGEKY